MSDEWIPRQRYKPAPRCGRKGRWYTFIQCALDWNSTSSFTRVREPYSSEISLEVEAYTFSSWSSSSYTQTIYEINYDSFLQNDRNCCGLLIIPFQSQENLITSDEPCIVSATTYFSLGIFLNYSIIRIGPRSRTLQVYLMAFFSTLFVPPDLWAKITRNAMRPPRHLRPVRGSAVIFHAARGEVRHGKFARDVVRCEDGSGKIINDFDGFFFDFWHVSVCFEDWLWYLFLSSCKCQRIGMKKLVHGQIWSPH